jgi:hypothetical protein
MRIKGRGTEEHVSNSSTKGSKSGVRRRAYDRCLRKA